MTSHHKSLIRQVLDRLDSLMAIGQSRRNAKEEAKAAGVSVFGFSTGRMHSYKTRETYQEHCLRFANWVRQTYSLKHLEEITEQANAYVSAYLQKALAEGKSPSTLLTIRSALRMLFGDRRLAEAVAIPQRHLTAITRSRGPKRHDAHFQPANWPELVAFLKATGLRRDEVKMLRVEDIHVPDQQGVGPTVLVRRGKGGKARTVPVLAGSEQAVLSVGEGCNPNARVFSHIPRHLDVQSYRRMYAQALYQQYAPHQSLPPPTERLRRGSYDRAAALAVSRALGHRRLEVVLRHYLR